MDASKLDKAVLDALEERGVSKKEIECMSPEAVFSEWCSWEGFLGWSETIHRIHESIFSQGEKEMKEFRVVVTVGSKLHAIKSVKAQSAPEAVSLAEAKYNLKRGGDFASEAARVWCVYEVVALYDHNGVLEESF